MDDQFETLVIEAADILGNQENWQWRVGELSQKIVETYGFKALEDFSKQIEQHCGVKRTPGSLRMYAYTWLKSSQLGLPKDILFSGCQSIIFSGDPVKYARLAKGGASRVEIIHQIYEDKTTQES